MSIQQWSERIWVAKLGDDPTLSEDLGQLLETLERPPSPDLVLEMTQVSALNSSHLSKLLKLRKRALDHGARLRLAAPQDSVWATFLTTGLDQVFEFEPDVTTALAALQLGRDGESEPPE